MNLIFLILVLAVLCILSSFKSSFENITDQYDVITNCNGPDREPEGRLPFSTISYSAQNDYNRLLNFMNEKPNEM